MRISANRTEKIMQIQFKFVESKVWCALNVEVAANSAAAVAVAAVEP